MRNKISQGKFYTKCSNVRKDSIAGAFKKFDESIRVVKKIRRVYFKNLESKYIGFCKYRHEVSTNKMPDYKKSLFSDRLFHGRHFEIA